MVHIKIKKGLNIPIEGAPTGEIKALPPPQTVALNLQPFVGTPFKLLVAVGDTVKIGTPLVEDKRCPGRICVSPAGGVVKEILRGEKRVLLNIVIEVAKREEVEPAPDFRLESSNREQVTAHLLRGGLFAYIRRRPFNLLANPAQPPRSIFVKALSSAPFSPCAKTQVEGQEREFAAGLLALTKLTDGSVHLVHRTGGTCQAFTEAVGVVKHTAEGPHPVSNASLHIERIDPITSTDDVVWTVDALDVVRIGHWVLNGRVWNQRVIGIGGSSILPEKRGFFRVRDGSPIAALSADRIPGGFHRLISGDPLMGAKVENHDYLGFTHTVFCAIPESHQREFLSFCRPGFDKYTASGAYVTGHLDNTKRRYRFTTSLHGEHRPFVTNEPYDKVMPLHVPTMSLVKAVMAEDFEQAEQLGLLEVDSEDFALATFVCPSKMEMVDIIRKGLAAYAAQVIH
jgi:Na+-transporting NADH:ubiquinone oxidoreductase subunit A